MTKTDNDHIVRVRIEHREEMILPCQWDEFYLACDSRGEVLLSPSLPDADCVHVRINSGKVHVRGVSARGVLVLNGTEHRTDSEIALENQADEFSLLGSARFQISPRLASAAEPERVGTNADCGDLLDESQRELKIALKRLENERVHAELQLGEKRRDLDVLSAEHLVLEQKIAHARHLLESLEQASTALESGNTETQRQRRLVAERLSTLQEEVREQEDTLRKGQSKLKELGRMLERETSLREFDERTRKAKSEALDAEFKVRQLTLETRQGEAELKCIEANRELQSLMSRHAEYKLTTETEHRCMEQRIADATSHLKGLEDLSGRLSAEIEQKQLDLRDLSDKVLRTETALAGMKNNEKQISDELRAYREAAERKVDEEMAERRKALEVVIERYKNSHREETESSKANLEESYKRKQIELERFLNETKQKEMARIQELTREAEKAELSRKSFMVDEIVNVVNQMVSDTGSGVDAEELGVAVTRILEGKSPGNFSARAAERSRRFWTRYAIGVGVPTAIALVLYLFPGIAGGISERMRRTIASETKESGDFLKEIRKKGEIFRPEMNRQYRTTYADNILYLQDYVEMKLDDKTQSAWTLALNDFLVGRLGLSDRIIPEFLGTETVMFKELLKIRESILPQFREQGFGRLAEAEIQEGAKLRALLQDAANYEKFRSLEKSFYESWQAKRAPASEQKR